MMSSNPPQATLADMKQHPKPKDSWGFHLLIDMSKCNERIDSVDAVETFFDELIEELDMKPLSDIMIKKVEGEDGRGISAVQMITTSSITFHSDDDKRSVYLDIFSCKDFNPKQALKFVCDFFQPKEHAAQMIYRDAGLK
jgi:S-adenosylmethionine/arginine decarboxylase-like enzyme